MSLPRIASLLASATETLYALGLGDCVVAVSHECDFPEEVRRKPRVTKAHIDAEQSSGRIDEQVRTLAAEGRPLYEIDVRALVDLAPDLIVTQAHCEVCAVSFDDVVKAVRECPSLAGARIIGLNPTTLDAIIDDTRRVAEAAGCLDRGDRLAADMSHRIEQVRRQTASLVGAQRPRVVCLEWVDPPFVAANWMPELVEAAGGRHDLSTSGRPSRAREWDELCRYDPEVLIVMPCGFDLARAKDDARRLSSLPGWNELAAVRTARTYVADGNAYFNRSGPRIIDSLEMLAAMIHPRIFERQFSGLARHWSHGVVA